MQGDRPARLLHYNYLPIAMSAIPNPDFFFNNPFEENVLTGSDFYSEAEATTQEHVAEGAAGRTLWLGNFFPDMGVWDKLMHRPRTRLPSTARSTCASRALSSARICRSSPRERTRRDTATGRAA